MAAKQKQLLKDAVKNLAKGRLDEASQACIEVLKTKDGRDNFEALVYLGKATYLQGEHAKSFKAYKRATEVNPHALEGWKGILELGAHCEDNDSRVRAYEELIDATEITEEGGSFEKWLEYFNGLCALQHCTESFEELVVTKRKATEKQMPERHHIQTLRSYCDGFPDLAGTKLAASFTPEIELLAKLFEKTKECSNDGKYHLQYLKRLLDDLVSHPTGEEREAIAKAAWDVCIALIGSDGDEFALQTILKLVDETGTSAFSPEFCEKGQFPTLPVNDEFVKYSQKLAHSFPWTRQSWPNLVRVLLQNKHPQTLASPRCSQMRKLLQKYVKTVSSRNSTDAMQAWMLLSHLVAQTDAKKAIICMNKSVEFASAAAKSGWNVAWVQRLQRLCLGLYHQQTGSHEEALRILREVAASCQNPNTNNYRLMAEAGMGQALMSMGKWSEAEPHLAGITSARPELHQALSDLGWVFHKTGRRDNAVDMLTAAIAQAVKKAGGRAAAIAEHHYRLGRVYWSQGGEYSSDRKYAYSHLLSAAGAKDSNPSIQSKAFKGLGDFYRLIGDDTNRALKCYTKALQIDPRREGAGRQACLAMQEQANRNQDLIEICSHALDKEGQCSIQWPLKPLALALAEEGRYSEAIPAFQRALRVHKICARCWEGLGICYKKTAKYHSAIKAFNRALELSGDRTFAMMQLGSIYGDVFFEHERAYDMFMRALKVQEGEESSSCFLVSLLGAGRALFSMSRRYYSMGAFGCASKCLNQISDLLEKQGSSDAQQQLQTYSAFWKLLGDVRLEQALIPDVSTLLDCANLEGITDHISQCCKTKSSFIREAREAYSKVIGMTTCLGRAWHDLALTFYAESRLNGEYGVSESDADMKAKACEALMKGLSSDPDDPALWAAMGIVSEKENVMEYCLCRSLQLKPNSSDTWVSLAIFYMNRSVFDLAEQCLQNARVHQASSPHSWAAEGVLRVKVNSNYNSRELFEQAVHTGNNAYAHVHYALESIMEGPTAELRKEWVSTQMSLRLDPLNPLCYVCNGVILERSGDFEESVASLKVALFLIQTKDVETLREQNGDGIWSQLGMSVKKNLARVLFKAGKFTEVCKLYDEVKQKCPGFEWDASSGLVYFIAKSESNTLSQEDIEAAPASIRGRLHLRVLLQKGQVKEAVGALAKFQSSGSDDETVLIECWLMLLTSAVISNVTDDDMDYVRSALMQSPVQSSIYLKLKYWKLMALKYCAEKDDGKTSRMLAKIVHTDPGDLLSKIWLLHTKLAPHHDCLNTDNVLVGALQCPDLHGLILSYYNHLQTKDMARCKRILSKCMHKHPEINWKLAEGCTQ